MKSLESPAVESAGKIRRLRCAALRHVIWSQSRSRLLLACIASLLAIWARPLTFAPRLSCFAGIINYRRISGNRNLRRATTGNDNSELYAIEDDDWDLDLGENLQDDWGTVDDDDYDIDGIDGVDPALIASILDSDSKDMPVEIQAEAQVAKDGIPASEPEPTKQTTQEDYPDARATILEELRKEGKLPNAFLDDFDNMAKGGTPPGFYADKTARMKWKDVPLNETWTVQIAEPPWATDRLISMVANTKESDQTAQDILNSGALLFPGAVVLARWLCVQPPLVDLSGRSVLELGAGVGLPGLVAAKLGAKVLLQDIDRHPLKEAMESCVKAGVVSSVTSLCCDWQDLPAQLMAGQEALAPFGQADVMIGAELLVDEAAAESLAMVLSILLRLPSQVAYLVDAYRRPHRKHFVTHCQSLGLDAQETEIVVWEPEHDWAFEIRPEWTVRLLTVRRA
eukprot:TRINITY_DN20769_c0_g1_i1.p1 TRINITY_DN20769_c0_g1~~TRINITY_DN20769_c0_g1_i1.p1  ORF type:complete len:454 (+),score=80.32 TRINITY_DN20769_c0_g1_i1:21-1382(+)